MEHARPPAELVLEGGPAARADAWRKWYRQFEVFLKASGAYKENSDVRASLLINLIGVDGYDIFTTFKLTTAQAEDVDIIVKKYNEYFGTKQNTTMCRFKFFSRHQEIGETIDNYVTALRLLSQQCEFDKLEDGLIRDRIVCGVSDGGLRDRLLRADELTLDKAIKICQANELSYEENRQIEGIKVESVGTSGSTMAVDALYGARGAAAAAAHGRGAAGRPCAARGQQRGGGGGGGRAQGVRAGGGAGVGGAGGQPGSGDDGGGGYCPPGTQQRRQHAAGGCYCCGGMHPAGDDARCPAKAVKCYLCSNKGHFKKMCPFKRNKMVYELNEDDEQLFYISTLEGSAASKDTKWYETLILCSNRRQETFKLDTGSDLNVMSLHAYLGLGLCRENITPTEIKAQSFCGNFVPIIGYWKAKWLYKMVPCEIKIIISNDDCQNILGKYTCEELGLIKRIQSKAWDDSSTHPFPQLTVGERVVVREGVGSRARHMTVQAKAPQPRSYFLTDQTGRCYRRNRRHIISKMLPSADIANSPPTSSKEKRSEGDTFHESAAETETGFSDDNWEDEIPVLEPQLSTRTLRALKRHQTKRLALIKNIRKSIDSANK